MTSELFKLIPTDLLENLEYRHKLLLRAHGDKSFQADMMKACKHDFLFFLGSFVYLYEPRPRDLPDGRPKPTTVPFIPWPHQIPVILQIKANIGRRDLIVKKSRGEGMSWIGVLCAVHDWLFFAGKKIGLVSSTELKADNPDDWDSLLGKVDFELARLPKWMSGVEGIDYKRDRTRHLFINFRNNSQISAFAAVADAGRSGRYTWFMPDELGFWDRPKDQKFMDSIRSSTDSRLIISTPNGMDGAYYKICKHPGNALTLELSWRDNPSKNRGMYQVIGDKPFLIDPVGNPYPDPLPPGWQLPDATMFQELRMKQFKIENSIRSPWYDNECLKPDATPRSIAMELDMDFGGSMQKYFLPDFTRAMEGSGGQPGTLRPPMWKGAIDWLNETLKISLIPQDDGKEFKLWCPLDKNNLPPLHSFVLGIDLSRGEGGSHTSNSVCSILDLVTMEQVGEWVTNTVDPIKFADGCIALAKLFHGAYMIWEHNGPGNAFGKQVLARRYGNVHYRQEDFARSKQFNGIKKVGWVSGKAKKNTLLEQFRRCVTIGEFSVRSHAVADECTQYIWDPTTGTVRHQHAGRSTEDPDQGEQHGDRVIAIALALEGAKERPLSSSQLKDTLQRASGGGLHSFGGRLQKWQDSQQEQDDDPWDSRSNLDLMRGGISLLDSEG